MNRAQQARSAAIASRNWNGANQLFLYRHLLRRHGGVFHAITVVGHFELIPNALGRGCAGLCNRTQFVKPQVDYHYVPGLTDQFGGKNVPMFMMNVGYGTRR